MTAPINATSDQSTVTLFPRLPYKLPTVSITVTIGGLVMRMSSFGINDSIVAALGLGIVVWMGLIYAELLRRNRILRAIFKKYPKGIVWNSVCFYDKICNGLYPLRVDLLKFANHETDATVVNDTFETGYQNYKFADIDTDFVLRPELTRYNSTDRDDTPPIDRHKTLY